MVVPGPFGLIETHSRPLWTVSRPCCARCRHVHAPVLVLRSRHRWFDSQRRLFCRSPFWSVYWCDAKLSVCGHLWTTGKNAPMRAQDAPKMRPRDARKTSRLKLIRRIN